MASPTNNSQYITPASSTNQIMYIPINAISPHSVPMQSHVSAEQQSSTFLVEQAFGNPKISPLRNVSTNDILPDAGSKRNVLSNLPTMFINNSQNHYDIVPTIAPAITPSPMPIQTHLTSISHHPTHLIDVGTSEPNASLLLVSQHAHQQKNDHAEEYATFHLKKVTSDYSTFHLKKVTPEKDEKEEENELISKQPTKNNDVAVKNEQTDQSEQLKKIVSELNNPTVVWRSVREQILSHCQVWDILLDKASLSYFYETKTKKLPKDNLRKFQSVLAEIESLLGEFKCFMDGCLEEDCDQLSEFNLGPEVSRAFEEDIGKLWKMKEKDNINSFYTPFFNNHDSFNDLLMCDNFDLSNNGLQEEPYIDYENEDVVETEGEGMAAETESDDKPIGSNNIYNCSNCGKIYTRQQAFEKHQQKCPSANMLKSHDEKTRPDCQKSLNLHTCSVCEKSFPYLSALNKHEKNHATKQDAPSTITESTKYACDFCDFSTSALNGLSLHKRRLHNLDKNNQLVAQIDNPDYHNRDPNKFKHECSRCTRRYKKIHHLERHLMKCDGIPPPTLKPMWQKNPNGRFSCKSLITQSYTKVFELFYGKLIFLYRCCARLYFRENVDVFVQCMAPF